MPRNCVNNQDNFCYICGEATFASQKRNITAVVKKTYHHYFGWKVGDQDKSWAPHYCCNKCATNLCQWLNRKRRSMLFAIPMVWGELTDHNSNCYFYYDFPSWKKNVKKEEMGSGVYKYSTSSLPCTSWRRTVNSFANQNPTLWTQMMIMMMTRIQLALSHQH